MDLILSTFLGVIALICFLRVWWRNTLWGKTASIVDNEFQGPPGWFLLGNVPQFKKDPAEVTKQVFEWYQTYGSPTKFKFGPFANVHLYRADHVEAILKSTTNITKSRDYEMISDWLGHGLLVAGGKRWFRKRKLLTPAFHFQILKDFMPVYNEQAEKFVQFLKSETEKPYDISKILSLCTLDIICETAMGIHLNAMGNANSDYVNAIMDFAETMQYRTMNPVYWPSFTFYNLTPIGRAAKQQLKILHEFTKQVITERESEFADVGEDRNQDLGIKKRRLAFLDLLLEMKRKGELNKEEIREEVDTFMFEGHDTTATGLMWAIYCIGWNPECQKRIQEEIMDVLGDDLKVHPTPDQLHELKYLECCIKESQRMYPSVPLIARKITEPLKIDDTYTIPEGVVVDVNFVALHRDPEYFPEPMKYDPDRFLPENSANRHPFAFAPFSAGPRNCIGQKFAMMEEKVILCHFFRNFTVESLTPHEKIDPSILLVFRPTNGIIVKLTQRY